MKIKNITKKKVAALIMAVVMLFPTSVSAVARPTAQEVPVGTMIIGTHLIALRSLTSQIYEIAQKSAVNENQHSIYYRSEFADDKWCDITKAQNILNLTATSGSPVNNAVIDTLVLTHYTMVDGKTYDLTTETAVNVCDIISPYDTNANSVLKPLKILADSLSAEGVGPKDIEKRDLANKVLKNDYHTKETDAIDKQIADMGAYIGNLYDVNASEQTIKSANALQEKLDNNRRVLVYNDMVKKTEEVINEAGKSTDDRGALNDLVSLLSDAQKKLNEDIQALNGKTMEEGTTDAQKQVNEAQKKMLDAVKSKDYAAASSAAQTLSNAENISANKIVDREKELETALKSAEEAEKEYKEELAKGDTGALKKAVESKSATQIKVEQDKIASALEEKRSALQEMVSAVSKRKLKSEKEAYIKERLKSATDMKSVIPKDHATSIAQGNLEKNIAFLSNELSAVAQITGVKSEAVKLSEELVAIKEKTKDALDKNDIEQADLLQKSEVEMQKKIDDLNKNIKAEIDILQKKKEEIDKEIEKAIASKDDVTLKKLAAEKTDIELEIEKKKSELSDDSQAQSLAIKTLKDSIISVINAPESTNEDYTTLSAPVEQLAGYSQISAQGTQLAGSSKSLASEAISALKEIKKSLVQVEALSSVLPEELQKVSTLVDKALADSALNKSIDETVTTTASVDIPSYNEKAVFDEIIIDNVEYVPLSVIPYVVNLRLVIESENTQILSNGGKYYKFSTGSETVKSAKGDIDGNGKIIRRSDKLFVPRKFAEEQLSLLYIKLPNAGKAVVISKIAKTEVS